jgi:hypothetical protein
MERKGPALGNAEPVMKDQKHTSLTTGPPKDLQKPTRSLRTPRLHGVLMQSP